MPTRYIGQAPQVRGDSRLVHLFHHGDLTKVHARQPAGGRATDYADYPAERTPYALRAPDRCIDQAQRLGPAVGQFITVLLRGTFPWARLRQAQKLLRLAERYGPDRITRSRHPCAPGKLSHVEFLELLLQDEIDRRDSHGLTLRLEQAGFEETATFEQIVWGSPVSFDRARVRELFSLHWLAQQENVIFCGPVGVGKTFLACALGHSACRAGHRVRCVAVTKLLQALHQSRADNSFERELRSWLAPDLLPLDDFGLRKLTAQQSSDFYDVLVECHRRAATIITSNRAVDEDIVARGGAQALAVLPARSRKDLLRPR